jgi:hypothetical protein
LRPKYRLVVHFYTEKELAALELTEAVTVLTDEFVPDEVDNRAAEEHFEKKELAHLIVSIVVNLAWNRFGVSTSDLSGTRRRLCRAALEAQNAGKAVFIGSPLPGGKLKHPALFMDGVLPTPLRTAPVLRIGENYLGPLGQLLAGPELACDVEFWEDGAQLLASDDGARRLANVQPQASEDLFAESLVAPRNNGITDVLPASEQSRRLCGAATGSFRFSFRSPCRL